MQIQQSKFIAENASLALRIGNVDVENLNGQ